MIVQSITDLIGNTPLLKIPKSVHGLENIDLYAKLELFNPWGSVKDRTAWGILQPHLVHLPYKKVIESSSGNTAKGLQMIASLHKSSVHAITNRIRVSEEKAILQLLGTKITELPGKSDCFDPNDPQDPVMYIQREIADHPDQYIHSDQYFNDNNRQVHFETTGKEIEQDLEKVDYFIGGLGTTGSTLGTAQRLKASNGSLIAVGVVAESEDFIPGIRTQDEVMEVGLFQPSFYNKILTVSSSQAIERMLQLIRNVGLLAGPTTGASLEGAIQYLQPIDTALTKRQTAVMIACDRVEWYISYIQSRRPDLFGSEAQTSWQDKLNEEVLFNDAHQLAALDALNWISQKKGIVIDLRQEISYKLGHLAGSINIPFEILDKQLNITVPFCTHLPLLFLCPIGKKSKMIANFLQSKEIEAYSIEGGFTAWKNANLPYERDVLVCE